MATAYLQGGPCAGRTVTITPDEADSQTILCGGHTYHHTPGDNRKNGDLIFADQGVTSGGGSGSQTVNAPRALKGWKAVRKAWNRKLPATINYATHGNDAALRSLHKARKVRL